MAFVVGTIMLFPKAWAATYYIDPTCRSSGNGSTTICGTSGPFKTWAEVPWGAGNTYSQKGGTTAYEQITVKASGTPGKVITINSYGKGRANLNGGITIPSSSWKVNDPVTGVYSMTSFGRLTLEDSVFIKQASSSRCTNGNQYFASGYKNYYKPTSGTPASHTVEKVRDSGIEIGANSFITITGFNFTKYRTDINGIVKASGTANNFIIIKNNMFINSQFGISISTNNYKSINNKIIDNTFDSIFSSIELHVAAVDTGGTGNFSGAEIANNTITHCSEIQGVNTAYAWDLVDRSGWDKEGVGTQNLINSNVHDNKITGNCRGVVLYVGNASDGSNNYVYKNYINTNNSGLLFLFGASTPSFGNNNIYTNIVIGGATDPTHAAVVLGNGRSPSFVYNNFYNNTVIFNNTGIYSGFIDYYRIVNNIFYNSGSVNHHIGISNNPAHMYYNYNLYFPSRGGAYWNNHDSSMPWRSWKALGYDANSLAPADPHFFNAAGGDYTLNSSSPAKWAGANIGLKSDYSGKSVHNPPSIGAYEYISTPVPTKVQK